MAAPSRFPAHDADALPTTHIPPFGRETQVDSTRNSSQSQGTRDFSDSNMHDPFAALDPMDKSKTMMMTPGSCASVGLSPTAAYQTAPMGMPMSSHQGAFTPPNINTQGNFMTPPPPAPYPYSPNAMAQSPFATNPPIAHGASFMTQPSTPSAGYQGFNHPPQHGMATNPFGEPSMTSPSHAVQQSQQPIMYDSIKNLLQPQLAATPTSKPAVDPFGSTTASASASAMPMSPASVGTRTAEPTPTFSDPFGPSGPSSAGSTNAVGPARPPALQGSSAPAASSIVADFDPFSPRDNTPAMPFDFAAQHEANTPEVNGGTPRRSAGRQTQEEQRSQLGFSPEAFKQAAGTPRVSLKNLSIQDASPRTGATRESQSPRTVRQDDQDDTLFMEGSTAQDAFASQAYGNVDDMPENSADWAQVQQQHKNQDDLPDRCSPEEYDVTFDSGRKLGVLMERMDVWGKSNDRRQEVAVVKLVVENGAADRVGVTVGSSVVGINHKSVARESYSTVLDIIKSTPRPMTVRFKRATVNKDSTQGNVLTRISNGTFSVGNFTSGNATWTAKYYAFGGAKMDVLQLFVSRAAYHECVISLYEKRVVHTQIQSFRLCRDHKISPIKTKIYKGYGNLHYFSLSVPSLRFVAAKFASEDYETLKNLWSHTYEAIERKKRMG